MDARLVYWTWAFVDMLVVVACALEGVRRIRRRELVRHRQFMIASACLVGVFVASYVVKVPVLGKEALATWDDGSILILRIHETCVLVMLVSGACAGALAYRLRRIPISWPRQEAPKPSPRRVHRAVGWTAVVASLLGVITAALVLQGMYGRRPGAGGPDEVEARPVSTLGSFTAAARQPVRERADER